MTLTLKDIHSMMGILTPFEGELSSPNGVQLKSNGANLFFRNGVAFIIDPETGKEYQASIYIKEQKHLRPNQFREVFKKKYRRNFIGYDNKSDSRKIHLGKCSTINTMIQNNIFHKYHGSNNQDGHDRQVTTSSGDYSVPLKVCLNCIKELSIGAKMGDTNYEPNNFNFKRFFSLKIGTIPEPEQGEFAAADTYPTNWSSISAKYRAASKWICECCAVDLSLNKELLDTHHINKRKSDCRDENLQALCKLCHAHQPHHQHMQTDFPYLKNLRSQQGIYEACACGAYK